VLHLEGIKPYKHSMHYQILCVVCVCVCVWVGCVCVSVFGSGVCVCACECVCCNGFATYVCLFTGVCV